jgi:hypothetical protein
MRKVLVLAVLVSAAAPIQAKPDTAATVDKTMGCYVSDANGEYAYDPACSAQFVYRYDEEGNLLFVNYRDAGTLQPGQVAPSSSLREDVSGSYFGLDCIGQEVVAPSGKVSSTLHCR